MSSFQDKKLWSNIKKAINRKLWTIQQTIKNLDEEFKIEYDEKKKEQIKKEKEKKECEERLTKSRKDMEDKQTWKKNYMLPLWLSSSNEKKE